MTETTKIILAVAAAIIIGFVMVGANKQQSTEQMETAAMIRTYAAMSEMANKKCPLAILKETGEQVYFPSDTKTDKDTYMTLNYAGESKFKNASCTLKLTAGGISDLIIDDKVVIKKAVK